MKTGKCSKQGFLAISAILAVAAVFICMSCDDLYSTIDAPEINDIVAPSEEIFVGDDDPIVLAVRVSNEEKMISLSYQWFKADTVNGSGTKISGGEEFPPYEYRPDMDKGYDKWFWVEVTNTEKKTATGKKTATARSNKVNIVVSKHTPTIDYWPTVENEKNYGEQLSKWTLKGGSASVAGEFHWTDGTIFPKVNNEKGEGYKVTFTPNETEKYNTVEKEERIVITVNPRNLSEATVIVSGSYQYTGNAHKPTKNELIVSDSGATITSEDWEVQPLSYNNNINAGTTSFTITATDDGNYNGSQIVNFTIDKADGADVGRPELSEKTHNSITIEAITTPDTGQGVEYGISTTNNADTANWQTELSFNGRDAVTTYFIFARTVENANYKKGAVSESLEVKTESSFIYRWDDHDVRLDPSSGSVSPGEDLHISIKGNVDSIRQWYLNGDATGKSGKDYYFSSYKAGKHTVTLFFEKYGRLYSIASVITVK